MGDAMSDRQVLNARLSMLALAMANMKTMAERGAEAVKEFSEGLKDYPREVAGPSRGSGLAMGPQRKCKRGMP